MKNYQFYNLYTLFSKINYKKNSKIFKLQLFIIINLINLGKKLAFKTFK